MGMSVIRRKLAKQGSRHFKFRFSKSKPAVSVAGFFCLTMAGELWEIAHMTTLVKADSRGRVPIRGTKSRRQYLVTAENGGWWVRPAPKFDAPKKVESPAGAWDLRAATLESFYDKSKAW
jgi:hypothetical protein